MFGGLGEKEKMQAHKDSKESFNKRPFNLQEAVILLDVYLSKVKNGTSITEAAETASVRLRSFAKSNGYVISDSYRSASGLVNRLRSLRGLYEGQESKSAPGTLVFAEVVSLYKNNRTRYEEILSTEKGVASQNGWKLGEPLAACGKMTTAMPSALKAVQEAVEIQPSWIKYDFTNAQRFEYTIPAYCAIAGVLLEGKNWARILVGITEQELDRHNTAMDRLYKESLIAEKKGRPYLLEDRLDGLNCAQLSNGYWICINYNIPRLMEMIRALCFRCGYAKEQIVLYGEAKASVSTRKKKTPSAQKKGASLTANGYGVSIEKSEAFLRSAGLRGATVKALIKAVQPDATVSSTTSALEGSLNVVAMPGNRYVHVDNFVDLDEAEDALGQILQTHFAQFGGYSNSQLLFGAASQELSMFLNDNDCENIDAVYAIARFLFEKKAVTGTPYRFSPPHIFEKATDYPMTLRGLMIHLARNNGGILYASDAKDYLQKTMLSYGGIGQLLQLGCSDTFLIYDSGRYLLSESLGIDEAWCMRMHDRLDDLFRKANVAYVIPRDINVTWLTTLPVLPNGLGWTLILLQEVLDKYPAIGFKSISPDLNQTHDTLAAAFVPVDSPLQTFPDVVTLFMEEHHDLPMRMPGEELRLELRNAGMLENSEMIYALPKALSDYRFAWSNENKTVYVRGNK